MNESKHENFSATLGQAIDCLREVFAFFPFSNDRDDVAGLLNEDFLVKIGHAFHRNDLAMTENVDRDIARCGEEEGLDEADRSRAVCADQPKVGFLHEVVHVRDRRKHVSQVRPQCRLVRLDLLVKPPINFRFGHGEDSLEARHPIRIDANQERLKWGSLASPCESSIVDLY